jgi:protein AroM
MKPILGLVTIGQTPRPDIEIEFGHYAPGSEIRVVGALDGYSQDEVRQFSAISGDYPLLAQLAGGGTAEIQRAVLAPLVELRAQQLAMAGAQLIVIVCTAEFPEITCPPMVLLPGKILPAIVGTINNTRHIGVVTSVAGQVSATRDKWTANGFLVKVTYADPHRDNELRQAATVMAERGPELVVLDCMGHSHAYRKELARLCGRPVLLAKSLIARVAGELMEL